MSSNNYYGREYDERELEKRFGVDHAPGELGAMTLGDRRAPQASSATFTETDRRPLRRASTYDTHVPTRAPSYAPPPSHAAKSRRSSYGGMNDRAEVPSSVSVTIGTNATHSRPVVFYEFSPESTPRQPQYQNQNQVKGSSREVRGTSTRPFDPLPPSAPYQAAPQAQMGGQYYGQNHGNYGATHGGTNDVPDTSSHSNITDEELLPYDSQSNVGLSLEEKEEMLRYWESKNPKKYSGYKGVNERIKKRETQTDYGGGYSSQAEYDGHRQSQPAGNANCQGQYDYYNQGQPQYGSQSVPHRQSNNGYGHSGQGY